MAEKEKRSFFERLTGAVNMNHDDDLDLDEEETRKSEKHLSILNEEDNSSEVGQLGVDVYQTPDAVFVKAMVAGVRPEDLDVSITRDMITIRGRRTEDGTIAEQDYVIHELYWGEFARTVVLPAEVEADMAEANEKHGLLVIKMPKIDREKQTRLRVKTI